MVMPKVTQCIWSAPWKQKICLATWEQSYLLKEEHLVFEMFVCTKQCGGRCFMGHSEPAPTSAQCRINGKWSGNSFMLSSSSLANHGG
jgi:hypothetical protein